MGNMNKKYKRLQGQEKGVLLLERQPVKMEAKSALHSPLHSPFKNNMIRKHTD
jgi:hypothetical protein